MTEVGGPVDSSLLEEQNGYMDDDQGDQEEFSEVTESSPEKQPKKKKTKRVTKRKKAEAPTTDDENGGENGDSVGESPNGGKKKRKKKPSKKTFERRNIKSLLTTDKLEESTKNALAQEQERLQRLQQAQRDAFATEVLRDFDLKQLAGLKSEHQDELESGILKNVV